MKRGGRETTRMDGVLEDDGRMVEKTMSGWNGWREKREDGRSVVLVFLTEVFPALWRLASGEYTLHDHEWGDQEDLHAALPEGVC